MTKEERILSEMEEQLRDLQHRLPVNRDLKDRLRHELAESLPASSQAEQKPLKPHKHKRMQRWGYGLAAAMLICIAVVAILWNGVQQPSNRVYAADLSLKPRFDTILQLGTDPSTAAAIQGDALYVAVPNEGIYKQEGLKMELLVERPDITSLRISPDGLSIGYTTSNGIYVYTLETRKERELLVRSNVSLLNLAWSPDSARILYVESSATAEQIWELELNTGEAQLLVNGSHPSYKGDTEHILYEQAGSIYTWSRDSQQSEFYVKGTQPVVSADGLYVLYVREDDSDVKLQNLWLADLDLKTEQQLTRNYTFPAEDGWWWGDIDQHQDEPQQPSYTFDDISWSVDGQDILFYQVNYKDPTRRQMVHLVLSDHSSQPQDVVASMITALIYRDEELAHQFFSYNPGYMKGTSPRQVNYQIHDVTTETNGKVIVDAEIMYSYQYPYYMVERTRFSLTRHGDRGYLIDSMETISAETIADWADGDISNVVEGQTGDTILHLSELPIEEGWSNTAFAQVLYDNWEGHIVWFMLRQERVDGQETRLRLMKADLDQGNYEAYGIIDGAYYANVLYVDQEHGYAAVTVSPEDGDNDIALISLSDAQAPVTRIRDRIEGLKPDELGIRLLKNGEMIFIGTYGERVVYFTYEL